MGKEDIPESTTSPEAERLDPEAAVAETLQRRRTFLKTCAALTGGVLVYSTPVVKAYGQTGTLSPPPPVFDIDLPANYSAADPNLDLVITLPGEAPVNVVFKGSGTVSLLATDNPDVADVVIQELRLDSVDPEPFESTGRLTATVQTRTIGQLNLRNGNLAIAQVPFILSSQRQNSSQEMSKVSSPQAQEAPVGDIKCKVFSDNDVSLSALAGATATGPFDTGLIPFPVNS